MKKRRLVSIAVFAIGILVIALSFSQFLNTTFQHSPKDIGIEKNERRQTVNDTGSVISSPSLLISSFSLPAPFVIQSHLPSCFLFEIFNVTGITDEVYTEEPSLYPDVVFQIIFRLIISTNAP